MEQRPGHAFVKRAIDITASLVVGAVAVPIIGVTALACLIVQGRPIMHSPTRAGKHGAPIRLLKFRSMGNQTDAEGNLLPDDQRLSRFGRFLRASSLDELPQLWNILVGDMSLVGPRPLPISYIERYTDVERRRLDVRPGLTGLAQIRGRNAIEWDERLRLDVQYVANRSTMADLRILASTVSLVVRRTGVSAHNHPTMPEFLGSAALAAEPAIIDESKLVATDSAFSPAA